MEESVVGEDYLGEHAAGLLFVSYALQNNAPPTFPALFHRNTVQICMSPNLPIMGLLRSKSEDRNSFENASMTIVFQQPSLLLP